MRLGGRPDLEEIREVLLGHGIKGGLRCRWLGVHLHLPHGLLCSQQLPGLLLGGCVLDPDALKMQMETSKIQLDSAGHQRLPRPRCKIRPSFCMQPWAKTQVHSDKWLVLALQPYGTMLHLHLLSYLDDHALPDAEAFVLGLGEVHSLLALRAVLGLLLLGGLLLLYGFLLPYNTPQAQF